MKIAVFILTVMYVTYLGYVGWGTGKLALEATEEVNKISCRPDCRLWKSPRYTPRKMCKKYCTDRQLGL